MRAAEGARNNYVTLMQIEEVEFLYASSVTQLTFLICVIMVQICYVYWGSVFAVCFRAKDVIVVEILEDALGFGDFCGVVSSRQ